MTNGKTDSTGSLVDRVRAEAKGPRRRWPRIVIAITLLVLLGGAAAFIFGRGQGWGKRLGISKETPYELMQQHMTLGKRAFEEGRFSDAIISYRQAIEAKGDVAAPHRMLGICYFRLEPPKEGLAVESLRKAQKLDEHDVGAALEIAQYHLRNGRHRVCLQICEDAQRDANITEKSRQDLRRSFLQIQWTAAQAAEALGDLDLAVRYARTYSDNTPFAGDPCLYVAYLLQRRYESNRDRADLSLADEYLATGQVRAEGQHEQARSNPAHLLLLAKTLIARGRHLGFGRTEDELAEPTWKREAADYYRQALLSMQKLKGWKLEGGNPTDQVRLRARIHMLLDEEAEAIALLRRENEKEPRWEVMASMLEVMLGSDDDEVLEDAETRAELAVKTYGRPEFALLLVRIKDRRGAEAEADRDLVRQANDPEASGEDSSLWLGIIAARLRGRGQVEESEKNYRAALAKNPRNLSARLGLLDIVGMRFLQNPGNLEARKAARAELELELTEVDKLNPGAPLARLWKGVTKFSDGRLSEARELLGQVVSVSPNAPLAQLILGRCQLRLGDMDGAIGSFKRVIALERRAAKAADSEDPPLESSCLALLTAYLTANRLEAAEAWGRDAVKYHPQSRELGFYLGTAYIRLEDYAAAQEVFERLTAEHPTWGPGYGMLGQSLYRRGLRRQAEDAFREGLRLDDRIDVRLIVARFFLGQGDRDRAEAEYKKIVERFPDDPFGYRLLGHFYHVTGQREKARETLARGLEIAPDYLPNYQELADTYLSAAQTSGEELAEARRLIGEVLTRDPENSTARLLLGRALLRQREVAESVEIMEELLQRYPDLVPAKVLLADGLLRSAEPDMARAREALEEVLAVQPQHPGAVALMSQLSAREAVEILRSGADPELANRRLIESLKFNPENVGARLLRADTLHRMAADDPRKLELAIHEAKEIIKAQEKSPLGYILLGEILSQRSARTLRLARAKDAIGETTEAAGLRKHAEADAVEAEALLETSLKLAPTFHGGPLALGEHYLRTQRFAEAQSAFTKSMANQPKDLRSFRGALISLLAQKKQGEAETLCRRRLETYEDPGGVVALFLGMILEERDPPTEAVTIYRQALERNKRSAVVAARLVRLLAGKLDRLDEALALLRALHEEVPESPYYGFEIGRLLLAQQKRPEAREALEAVLAAHPNYEPAYGLLFRAYALDRMIDEGIVRFDEYLRLNDLPTIRFVLGQLNETKKNYGLAQDHYEQVLLAEPDHHVAANNLAWILSWYDGNADRALALALRARAGLPENPAVADTLAWVYILQGEFRKAYELLETIESTQKDDGGYQLHCARALEGLGRIDEARRWLERAGKWLEDNPENPIADEKFRQEVRETRERIH